MEEKRMLKLTEQLFTGLFFAALLVFFAFYYNSHLHFVEQKGIFLFSWDYLLSLVKYPGGFSGYAGRFLTQFYYISFAGPVIIIILLFLIQRITRKILAIINDNSSFFPLSFLPSLNCAMILCDELYPLSAVMGFILALIFQWLYMLIKKRQLRFYAGFLFITASYFLAGGSFLMLIVLMILYEFIQVKRLMKTPGNRFMLLKYSTYLLFGFALPLVVRHFFIMQPLGLAFLSEFYYDLRASVPPAIPVLFVLPAILLFILYIVPQRPKIYIAALYLQILLLPMVAWLGFRQWANPEAESIMTYDYMVRNERWADVIKYSEKKPPKNNLSLAMLNLALAKTGQMGDLMFRYAQNGSDGLFLPFAREFVAPMMGSEIFFHLGLINASQEYSFESMETIPDYSKSARCLKRLAETNLINGNYEVAGKYLKILEKTLFYSRWAKETENYLRNEELINKHPVYGEKRSMMIRKDFFFKVQNMESTLNLLLAENKMNNMAFQYLMAFYMINKDLRNFMSCLPMMQTLGYKRIPVSYQEAIMYVIGLSSSNPMADRTYDISEGTKARMKSYADIYTTYRNARDILRSQFSGTYWYYLHYKEIEVQQ